LFTRRAVVSPRDNSKMLTEARSELKFRPNVMDMASCDVASIISLSATAIPTLFWEMYQGAAAMNCGMCGLISLPSSSWSAGARPACGGGGDGRHAASVHVDGGQGESLMPHNTRGSVSLVSLVSRRLFNSAVLTQRRKASEKPDSLIGGAWTQPTSLAARSRVYPFTFLRPLRSVMPLVRLTW